MKRRNSLETSETNRHSICTSYLWTRLLQLQQLIWDCVTNNIKDLENILAKYACFFRLPEDIGEFHQNQLSKHNKFNQETVEGVLYLKSR